MKRILIFNTIMFGGITVHFAVLNIGLAVICALSSIVNLLAAELLD